MPHYFSACLRLFCPLLLIPFLTSSVLAQSIAAIEARIIKDTNSFRKKQGRKALLKETILMRTAKSFACYMAQTGRYGHKADGRSPKQRAIAKGYPAKGCVGENIAWNNYNKAQQARILTKGWINSPPHRKNMLTRGAKITGVGVCQKGEKFYGVQLIGRKKRVSVKIINKTPYPVTYTYGKDRKSGTVPGHNNGWRSLTLSTCEYSKLIASQVTKSTNGKTFTKRKSAQIGEKQAEIIFK